MSVYSQAMSSSYRDLSVRGTVTFPSGRSASLTGSDIVSFTLSEGGEDGLLPGDALSASLDIVLDNSGGQWLAGGSIALTDPIIGAQIYVEVGVNTSDGYIYRTIGTYITDDCLSNENSSIITLNCHDSLYTKTSPAFTDTLTYPTTLLNIWNACVTQAGYEFDGVVVNGSLTIDAPPDFTGMTIRQVMGAVATVAGCFVKINRDNELALLPIHSIDYALPISPESYINRKRMSLTFGPVGKVRVNTVNSLDDKNGQTQEYTAVSSRVTSDYELSVSANPLFLTGGVNVQSLVSGFMAAVEGATYSAASFKWRGDPTLEVGQNAEITGQDGIPITIMVSRQTIKFDMGLTSECISGVPSSGGVSTQAYLARTGVSAPNLIGLIPSGSLPNGIITADKIAANAITAEKIVTGALDATVISAVRAKLGEITADTITTDELSAELGRFVRLHADTAGIDYLDVKDITSDTAIITQGTAGELYISRLAVTEANMVSLTLGELIVKGLDGAYYRLTVDSEGDVISEQVMITGDDIENLTIDAGEKIIEGTITCDKLNVSEIVGNSMLIGAIKAANIDVADLFAANATITALNAFDITGNKLLRLLVAGKVSPDFTSATQPSTAAKGDVWLNTANDKLMRYDGNAWAEVSGNGIVTSSIIIRENEVAISTPDFKLSMPSSGDESELIAEMSNDYNGLYVKRLVSDSVMSAFEGNVYTVGEQGDYASLGELFSDISGKALTGDVHIKLLDSADSGGALSGTVGGCVYAHPVNLFDRTKAPTLSGATASANITNGITVTSTISGTYLSATYDLGTLAELGLRAGDIMHVHSDITAGTGASPGLVLNIGSAGFKWISAGTTSGEVIIPATAKPDESLVMVFRVCASTSAPSGASAYFRDVCLEKGGFTGAYSGRCLVGNVSVENAAGLAVSNLDLSAATYVTNANLTMTGCSVNAATGIVAKNAKAYVSNCVGTCTVAVNAKASVVHFTGKRFSGTLAGGYVLDSASPETGGSSPSGRSLTVTACETGTYYSKSGDWRTDDKALYQGYSSAHGRHYGYMRFDFSALPSGASVSKMTITLKRNEGYGGASGVNVYLYGTSKSGASGGQPALSTGAYYVGYIGDGKVKSFALPSALAGALADGTYSALVMYAANDTSVIAGKSYSQNYCRISGMGSVKNAPRIEVQYSA